MSEEKKELKEGSFLLFKVDDDKKKKESSPDFTGTARLSVETLDKLRANGGMLRMSGWGKVSAAGKVYVSGYIYEQQDGYGDKAPKEQADSFMVTSKIAASMESGPLDDDNSPMPADTSRLDKNTTESDGDSLPF